MKKVIFIAQSTRVCGKSLLTFLLAEKYKTAAIFDLDFHPSDISSYLAYRKPTYFSLLDSHNSTDRNRIDDLFLMIHKSPLNIFLCDFGGTNSQQLQFYLKEREKDLSDILNQLEIELSIYVVVAGANIMRQSVAYLINIVNSINVSENIKICIAQNEHFEFTESQALSIKELVSLCALPVMQLKRLGVNCDSTKLRVNKTLDSGLGINSPETDPFTLFDFQETMNKLVI